MGEAVSSTQEETGVVGRSGGARNIQTVHTSLGGRDGGMLHSSLSKECTQISWPFHQDERDISMVSTYRIATEEGHRHPTRIGMHG